MVEIAYPGAIISSPKTEISEAVADSLGMVESIHECCTKRVAANVIDQNTSVSTGKQTAEPIGENAVSLTSS